MTDFNRRALLTGGAATLTTAALADVTLAGSALAAPAPSIHGIGYWVFANHKTVDRVATNSRPSYVKWISGYNYLENVHLGDGRFDLRGFDAIQKAAHQVGKPYALMVIPSTLQRGLPRWYLNGLNRFEIINIDRGTFPAWFSRAANARLHALHVAMARNYASDPLCQMVRINLFWATHGEPWIEGGAPGRRHWLSQYQGYTGNKHADYADLRAAYNRAEIAGFKEMDALFPRAKMSMATGFGYSDYVSSSNPSLWGRPSNHPQRLATFRTLRQMYGHRAVFQQNGAGDGMRTGNYDGASGFGEWLGNSFGPKGLYRGEIGAQTVSGVMTRDGRMDIPRFGRTIQVERGRGTKWLEVYEKDVEEAVRGASTVGRQLRNLLQGASSW